MRPRLLVIVPLLCAACGSADPTPASVAADAGGGAPTDAPVAADVPAASDAPLGADVPVAADVLAVVDAAEAGGPVALHCVTGVACDATQPHCLAIDVLTHEGSVCDCAAGAYVCHAAHAAAAACGGIGQTFATPCDPDTLLCSSDAVTPFPTCSACACDAAGQAYYGGTCHALYAGHEF